MSLWQDISQIFRFGRYFLQSDFCKIRENVYRKGFIPLPPRKSGIHIIKFCEMMSF